MLAMPLENSAWIPCPSPECPLLESHCDSLPSWVTSGSPHLPAHSPQEVWPLSGGKLFSSWSSGRESVPSLSPGAGSCRPCPAFLGSQTLWQHRYLNCHVAFSHVASFPVLPLRRAFRVGVHSSPRPSDFEILYSFTSVKTRFLNEVT